MQDKQNDNVLQDTRWFISPNRKLHGNHGHKKCNNAPKLLYHNNIISYTCK